MKGRGYLDSLESVRAELSRLDKRVKTLEDGAILTNRNLEELKSTQKQNHEELKSSHETIKQSQTKMTDENLEQTKILVRIEEKYQAQVEFAQKNEDKTLTQNKWLIGAIWGLVTIVLIVIITASVNAFLPH